MANTTITLTESERAELVRRARSRAGRADDARVARVLLSLADGMAYSQVAEHVGCSAPFISKWKKRFLTDGLAGLYLRHEGRKPTAMTPQVEARILNWTRKPPTDGSTHWSTRRLAAKLGMHHMLVARTWKNHGIKPHRFERYMASNDPEFEAKAADVLGLYLRPPQHALVLCVDEKTAIQALDRKDPVLPLSPGRAERHGRQRDDHDCRSRRLHPDREHGISGSGSLQHGRSQWAASAVRGSGVWR